MNRVSNMADGVVSVAFRSLSLLLRLYLISTSSIKNKRRGYFVRTITSDRAAKIFCYRKVMEKMHYCSKKRQTSLFEQEKEVTRQ